ncbi:hypothetical protein [Rossellomorea sp. NS-SX7]|uniref:hypothetical protein n=1 Tax=Rossellomorea sp. NS-SX7 TaxID=3463856 RepID=UPI00405A34BC
MRIRHCILMGVLVGAAAFLPNHAFAENNKGSGQSPHAHTAEVHTNAVEKVEKKDSVIKTKPAAPDTKGQKEEVQRPEVSRDQEPGKANRPQPEPPERSHRTDKAANPKAQEAKKDHSTKSSVKPEGKRQAENRQPGQKQTRTEVSESTEKPAAPSMVKPQRERETIFQIQQEKALKENQHSVSPKEKRPVKRKQVHEAGNKTPREKKENPGEVEAVSSTPQRLPSSGGQSQENLGHGAGMVSFLHHPAVWNIGLKLRTIYHSREDTYCYQWMNAPPSPPPKAAPFIS